MAQQKNPEDRLPPKPPAIVVTAPDTGRRYIVEIDCAMFQYSELPLISEEQKRIAAEFGPKRRFLYSRATYDRMVNWAKDLLSKGARLDRLEFVHARQSELTAFEKGQLKLVPIDTEQE